MRAVRPGDRRMVILGVAAAVVLAAGSTLAMAAAAGAFNQASPRLTAGSACLPPALPGARVDVRLTDMGAMRGGRYPSGPMMGGQYRFGMMRVLAAPDSALAGPVSFRVRTVGALTHELVVLPLPPGQGAGQRTVGGDAASRRPPAAERRPAAAVPGTGTASPLGLAAGSLCGCLLAVTSWSATCPATTKPACTPPWPSPDVGVPLPLELTVRAGGRG